MNSESVENYLTAILRLEEESGIVSNGVLAERLAITPASATQMLQKMARRGLLELERYRGARLTGAGRRAALTVRRRHRLVETFLVNVLGLAPDEVHEEAHRWEHVISDEVAERLDAFLGRPRTDPHGSPIPAATRRTDREE